MTLEISLVCHARAFRQNDEELNDLALPDYKDAQ